MSFEDSRGETFLYELARNGETTELIGYLKRGQRPVVRRRAAELLGDFADHPDERRREEIVQELAAAVESGDEAVRAQALDSLVRYGDDALRRLIDRLTGFDAAVAPRWAVAEQLVEWLDDDRPGFRLVAATGLRWFGTEDALPALVEAVSDPDPRVRIRAVRSCGSIGDDRAVEALAGRLTDPETRVQKAAADALGAIGTERALEALVPAARTADPEVRQVALDELGQYGSLEPLVVLLRALDDPNGAIRRTAIVSLVELFVHAPPGQSHEMRETVADQLAALSPADVKTQLVDVLAESDRWAIRRNAIWLLGELVEEADPEVQAPLVDALGDEDETTARLAATTLAGLGGEGLEKRLLLYLQDCEEGSPGWNRARFVLDQLDTDPGAELVTTGVDYTYVSEPEDYTGPDRERS